jgi:peptidoglycan/xylan/chitin deacetylase (PgdA/CDA1 family)
MVAQARTTIRAAALAAAIGAAATLAALPAWAQAEAQDCPGNPDAIGTSRTIPIDFSQYQRLGTLNYAETLPLADHEVVLTFDDGPIPPHTTKVLDVLSSHCVKALFFIVGEMAHAYPDVVRRIRADGHTIGTHSQDHPLRFDRISDAKVQWEIDEGIANVSAALGDGGGLSPFFRIPGFGRTDTVESELAGRSLVVFSTDVDADDWFRHIGPSQIIARAISRLEAKGKGMLLLHDIHPWTAAALPELLKQLKAHGFHIVQVVPGASTAPAIAARSSFTVAWSATDQEAIDDASLKPEWPQAGDDEMSETAALPAPDEAAFDPHYRPAQVMRTAAIAPDPASIEAGIASTSWPYQIALKLPRDAARLPAPSVQDIGWPVTATEQPVEDAAAELPPSAQPTAVQQVPAFEPGRGKVAEVPQRAEAPQRADISHHAEARHARVFNRRHAHARATGRQHAETDAAVTAMATPAH